MLCRNLLSQEKTKDGRIRVVILGSTGSIGESALELCRRFPQIFEVLAISAHKNVDKLSAQCREFHPRFAVLTDASKRKSADIPSGTTFLCGSGALCEIAALDDTDVVLAAIVGIACLEAVLAALHAKKRVALANKESVVCGGALLDSALDKGGIIVPVDSEHSSLFNCLRGLRNDDVSRLVLTASGGPFLNTPIEKLSSISPAEAVRHPRWNMGAKISVDSATMMNKALEIIEAYWLYGIPSIEVIVHPESIVHSLVGLKDGSMIAHMSQPDMKLPIAFGLLYPRTRLSEVIKPLSLAELAKLSFFELDNKRFPAVNLAYDCLKSGGSSSAVLSIANEIAVEAFLAERIRFTDIISVNKEFLESFRYSACGSLNDLRLLVKEMKNKAQDFLEPFLKN
ncbi:MAG: 1-deoxy-D-xylulose-5-phosphate reductoisomerase [SAR324 cluster bacterium]|uniref:1-deoxy-D-xylulose 5-phosphate reductoisomerase n=1 Tax=SAR324 cluster bacterium TaxID=2024889 RepID=A0A7X9FQQ1_9DELT|nr:1-deoxy-D-xylulose-5-phosphate reductoisomerase [SAR324 cluster bacterium]